MDAQGQEVSKI